MTEFTIIGNYEGKNDRFHEFYIREGQNSYTIHVNKTSTLLDELDDVLLGARIKTTGIVMKDAEDRNIFVSNKATITLGEEAVKGEKR